MSGKPEPKNCKAFLYVIGKEGREIFNTFVFPEEEKDKITPLLAKFDNYCIPKKNVTMERQIKHTSTRQYRAY